MTARVSVFSELRRRHVWRVAVAYAVAGWLLIQIATQVFPFFDIPSWSVRLVVVLIALGFPVAVILAWAFEMTPEGIRRTESADSPDARPEHENRRIGRKLNGVIMGVLVIAVALLGWRLLVLRGAPASEPVAAQHVAAAQVPATKPAAFKPPADTLVVLPFTNLGGDASQNYFSDGITEELTNALGQNTALRVIAWDTASKYRDSSEPATAIGKALNVANLLHGSIRRVNDRIRVTAELVDTITGYQLWSAHYDDNLKDVFAVQDRISQAIASALRVKFASTRPTRSVDPRAHDLVLRGLAAMNGRTAADYQRARTAFEQAITLDPDYAAAHAALARTWVDLTQVSTVALEQALSKARGEANKALTLDPKNVDALVALANADLAEGRAAEARARYKRAIAVDPSNTNAYVNYGVLLPPRQALTETLKAVQLDPRNTTAQNNLASTYLDLGEYQQALPPAQALIQLAPNSTDSAFLLALTYALLSRAEDAVKAFDLAKPTTPLASKLIAAGRLAYEAVLDPRQRPQALAAANAIRQRAGVDPGSMTDLMQAYLVLGDKKTALDLLSKVCALIPQSFRDLGVNPLFLPLRGDPKFEALVKKYDTAASASGGAAP